MCQERSRHGNVGRFWEGPEPLHLKCIYVKVRDINRFGDIQGVTNWEICDHISTTKGLEGRELNSLLASLGINY